MKNLILAVITVWVIISCDIAIDGYNTLLFQDIPIYYGDFTEIEDIKGITAYIKEHVEYKTELIETASSPEETLNNGFGDCEDIALLYLNILYVRFGITGDIALVKLDSRVIIDGGYIDHAIVSVEGHHYDPISLDTYDSIGYLYPFWDIFTTNKGLL